MSKRTFAQLSPQQESTKSEQPVPVSVLISTAAIPMAPQLQPAESRENSTSSQLVVTDLIREIYAACLYIGAAVVTTFIAGGRSVGV